MNNLVERKIFKDLRINYEIKYDVANETYIHSIKSFDDEALIEPVWETYDPTEFTLNDIVDKYAELAAKLPFSYDLNDIIPFAFQIPKGLYLLDLKTGQVRDINNFEYMANGSVAHRFIEKLVEQTAEMVDRDSKDKELIESYSYIYDKAMRDICNAEISAVESIKEKLGKTDDQEEEWVKGIS